MTAPLAPIRQEPVPTALRHIPQPVQQLYVLGASLAEYTAPKVAIIGSRKPSPYGKQITLNLATDLARAGATIISGLALGVDSLAHRAALDAGGKTIAVLPCHPSRIYPASHYGLARRIVEQGGSIISEYGPEQEICYKYNFVERNRIISGLADAVLITEATLDSGSLHTARFAEDQGVPVFVTPGNITSPLSAGTNALLKSHGHLVTEASDILHQLGLSSPGQVRQKGSTPAEQLLLDLLYEGEQAGEQLLRRSKLSPSNYSQSLTMLEITGKIRALGANQWAPA